MYTEASAIRETFSAAMDMAKAIKGDVGLVGYGVVELRGPDGELKECEPFANLVTSKGDEYYAKRGAAGIGTPNLAQPSLVNGMKLGTGVTAAAKTNTSVGTYITGSNKTFETTHPSVIDEAGETGWSIEYKCVWAAGTATNSAITEAVIVEDANVDDATSAMCISRVTFTAKNKTADDTLTITWKHTFLGA